MASTGTPAPSRVPISYVNSLVSYGRESAANQANLRRARDLFYSAIRKGEGQLVSGTMSGNVATQQFGLTNQQEFDAHQQALDRIAGRAARCTQAVIRW